MKWLQPKTTYQKWIVNFWKWKRHTFENENASQPSNPKETLSQEQKINLENM